MAHGESAINYAIVCAIWAAKQQRQNHERIDAFRHRPYMAAMNRVVLDFFVAKRRRRRGTARARVHA
jgi:hypothetical protein